LISSIELPSNVIHKDSHNIYQKLSNRQVFKKKKIEKKNKKESWKDISTQDQIEEIDLSKLLKKNINSSKQSIDPL
jgi:hypothetical protein